MKDRNDELLSPRLARVVDAWVIQLRELDAPTMHAFRRERAIKRECGGDERMFSLDRGLE